MGIKGYAHGVYNGTMINPLRHLSFPVIKCFELDDFQYLSFTCKNVTTRPESSPAPVILPLEFSRRVTSSRWRLLEVYAKNSDLWGVRFCEISTNGYWGKEDVLLGQAAYNKLVLCSSLHFRFHSFAWFIETSKCVVLYFSFSSSKFPNPKTL
jgi:hypothetical protein